MSVPGDEQPMPEELLARALESLSSGERQQVTMWLLSRTSGGGQVGGWLGKPERDHLTRMLSPGAASLRELYAQHQFSAIGVGGQGHQVVPVRLPAELHARLRTWSAEHGFSMATVVRGLVARFLDGQEANPEPES
jgi:hypothetical protein